MKISCKTKNSFEAQRCLKSNLTALFLLEFERIMNFICAASTIGHPFFLSISLRSIILSSLIVFDVANTFRFQMKAHLFIQDESTFYLSLFRISKLQCNVRRIVLESHDVYSDWQIVRQCHIVSSCSEVKRRIIGVAKTISRKTRLYLPFGWI